MIGLKRIAATTAIPLAVAACATVPDKSELEQLDGTAARDTLVGNTLTWTEDWGRYAEYYVPDGTSHSKAWGSWGSEEATAEYQISDDGEVCATYSGSPDWASGNSYCSVLLVDAEGNYYRESTHRDHEPSRVGEIRALSIESGDEYGLGS